MKINRRLIAILGIVFSSWLLGGCTLPFAGGKNAGITVTASLVASVYIDGQHVGETPLKNEKIKPGEHSIKLVAQDQSGQEYETGVELKPGVMLLIYREFAATPQEASGYSLDLEKINGKDKAEITIVSTPANAVVRIDDQPKGFAPLLKVGVNPGEHKVTLDAQGHKSVEIMSLVQAGTRLVVTAELGKLYPLKPDDSIQVATPSASPLPSSTPQPSPTFKPSPTPSPKPSPTPAPTELTKPYVEILTTPTGWLRVRSEPNGLADNEVAKVNSGEKYAFIESNDQGWYKIEYQAGKQGWVAAQFTKLYK